MKTKITILLLFISAFVNAQIYDNSKYYKIYDPTQEQNLEQLIDFTYNANQTELVDKTGNGHNLELVNSNSIELKSANSYIQFPLVAGFGTANFFIECYIDDSQITTGSGYIFLGGLSAGEGQFYLRRTTGTTRRIVLIEKTTGTSVTVTIANFPTTFFKFGARVRLGTNNAIDVYYNDVLVGTYGDLTTITDIGSTANVGNIGIPLANGTAITVGYHNFKLWNYDKSILQNYYPLAEGYGTNFWDVSGNNRHAKSYEVTTESLAGLNYKRNNQTIHYNLIRGFQLYEDTSTLRTPDIRVPLLLGGNKINPTLGKYREQYTYYAGNWYNYAETQFKQKASFLPYDNDNYFFTATVPNTMTFAETRLNKTNILCSNKSDQFYCDKSDSLTVKKILNYSKPLNHCLDFADYYNNTSNYRIIILAGQSNARGQEEVKYLNLWEKKTHNNCFIFNAKTNRIEKMVALNVNNLNGTTAVGFNNNGSEIFYGLRLSTKREKVIVIKAAYSGTQLFQSGGDTLDWNANSVGEYKDSLFMRIDSCTAQLDRMGCKYSFYLIDWKQGENDATLRYSAQYRTNENAFMSALRTKINTPNCPIFSYSTLDAYPTYSAIVRNAKLLNSVSISNYHYIEASSLDGIGDGLHISTKGQRQYVNQVINILNE